MPHQCTSCGHTFSDGSKQMLSGCPDCGGNKFQFLPGGGEGGGEGAADAEGAPTGESGVPGATTPPGGGEDAGGSSTAVRTDGPSLDPEDSGPSAGGESPKSAPTPEDGGSGIIDADAAADDREDRAQASARRTVVSPDELPASSEPGPETEPEDPPDIEDLRRELNQQFESIKILEPGQYELNLMELYDRDEYIIAIEEDGRYVIDVPSVDTDVP